MNHYSSETSPWARVCYGITIPGASMKGVRSSRSSGGTIRHSLIVPSDKAAWKEFLMEAGGPGIITIGCVPVQESLTLWVTAPFASITKAKKVFPSLLDIQLPFPLEDCMYQFLDVRRKPDNTSRALAVAARRENIMTLLESFQAHGVDPMLLDHEGVALWTQSIREMPLSPELTRIILYLEADHATVVIGTGALFLDAHSVRCSIPPPSDHVLPESSSDHSANAAADMIAQSIQRFLHAEVEPGTAVQWVGCGPGALNVSFMDALLRRLFEQRPGPLTTHEDPEFFLARALTTRALHREPLACNLRGYDLTHPAFLKRTGKQAVAGVVLFLIVGLILCGINVGWRLLSAYRLAQMKQAVSTLTDRLAPGARIPYGLEVAEAEKAVDRQSELVAPFLNTFTPLLSTRLANVINAGKECHLTFETLLLRKTSVSIAGTAEDWDQCDQFTQHLEAMGYSVALDRQEAVADNLVHFSVKGEAFSR